jgi:hypothetical protein
MAKFQKLLCDFNLWTILIPLHLCFSEAHQGIKFDVPNLLQKVESKNIGIKRGNRLLNFELNHRLNIDFISINSKILGK